MQPKAAIDVDVTVAHQNLRLIEHLEDLDDVQRVTANFNLPAEILAELDDLRSRVHELEGGRLLELEERIDFAERLLAGHSGAAPDALRSVEEQR